MDVRQLKTIDERVAARRLLACAFMHPFDEGEVRSQEAQAEHAAEELFGVFDEREALVAATSTLRHRLAFGGQAVTAGEFHMVGSLAESRGRGNVRELMRHVLACFRARGDLFSILIPFSFDFYRQFGFESCARNLTQTVPIEELACFACDMDALRVMGEDDVRRVRALWEAFALEHDLADLYDDAHWVLTGEGEWAERDFLHPDCARYSYLLCDTLGRDRAFLTVRLETTPENPFVGELHVTDLAYDSLEALGAVLGFCYRLRAKARSVVLELPDDIDLANVVRGADAVKRAVTGHTMARVLDTKRALALMTYPDGSGSFVIAVTDEFLVENAGTYAVSWEDGRATTVERVDEAFDLNLPIETFTQLVCGAATLDEACLKPGTHLVAAREVVRRVFCRRSVSLVL